MRVRPVRAVQPSRRVPLAAPLASAYRREAARIRLVVIDTMPLITAIIRLTIPETRATTIPIPCLHQVGYQHCYVLPALEHHASGSICPSGRRTPAGATGIEVRPRLESLASLPGRGVRVAVSCEVTRAVVATGGPARFPRLLCVAAETSCTRAIAAHCLLDPVSSFRQVLVFPNDDDEPTVLLKPCHGVTIAHPCAIALGRPPLGISFGGRAMLDATMPPAASDIDDDPRRHEHYVGGPTWMLK